MESCQSSEPYREDILNNAQENVRERFRTCVGRQTNAGLRSMGTEREGPTGKQGGNTDSWIEMRDCRSREYRARSDTLENTLLPTSAPSRSRLRVESTR